MRQPNGRPACCTRTPPACVHVLRTLTRTRLFQHGELQACKLSGVDFPAASRGARRAADAGVGGRLRGRHTQAQGRHPQVTCVAGWQTCGLCAHAVGREEGISGELERCKEPASRRQEMGAKFLLRCASTFSVASWRGGSSPLAHARAPSLLPSPSFPLPPSLSLLPCPSLPSSLSP